MSTLTMDSSQRQARQRAVEPRPAYETSKPGVSKALSAAAARLRYFFGNFSFEHGFTLIGCLASTTIVCLFIADLVWRWPLDRASPLADGLLIASGIGLLVACIDVFRHQTRQHSIMLLQERNSRRFEKIGR